MTGPQQPPYGGGQGDSWAGGGGEWQSPADQTQHGPPEGQPQGYDQYQQPQQYEQYDQYSAPPSYQDPYSAPPAAGYDPNAAMAPPPPPQQKSNALPWILGGVAALVVLVLCLGIGAVVLLGGDSDDGGGSTGGGGTDGGDSGGEYSGTNVTNACDLIDPDSMKKWADTQKEEPEHNERKSDYSSSFTCSASYEAGEYDRAAIRMSATVAGESDYLDDSYSSREKSAKGNTGTGRTSGDISGLGEKAFYASYVNDSDYSSSIMYEVGVLDDNLLVSINVTIFLGGEGAPDIKEDEVKKVCEDNAKLVMDGLSE